ncbi:MAG: 4-hydroxy-tetrahydrodipicolinate reductase [Woeseiaceae bacterium]
MTLNIAVLGAGRMGQEIMRAIVDDDELRLASVWTRKNVPTDGEIVVSNDLAPVLSAADVAIDFSLPEATPRVLDGVLAAEKPLVIGVSGLDEKALQQLAGVAQSVAVLYDRNMSVGIAVLDSLVRQAAASLASGFQAEIHETHHVHKIDAPSGTALALGASLAEARKQDFESVKRYEPAGLTRPLAAGEIGFEVTREGEVPGEHTVILYNASERLELKHAVSSRRVFADGALRAAKWLASQPPGQYRMRDLLFPTDT